MTGKLFVLEGPDGAGKTVAASYLHKLLNKLRVPNVLLSFPGKLEGTLGKFVYDFHHSNYTYSFQGKDGEEQCGKVETLPNTLLQGMHVLAHIETIQNEIIPALESDKVVILDRYWWSTKVYGHLFGADPRYIFILLELEALAWDGIYPDKLLVVTRPYEEADSSLSEVHYTIAEQQYLDLLHVNCWYDYKELRNGGTLTEFLKAISYYFVRDLDLC